MFNIFKPTNSSEPLSRKSSPNCRTMQMNSSISMKTTWKRLTSVPSTPWSKRNSKTISSSLKKQSISSIFRRKTSKSITRCLCWKRRSWGTNSSRKWTPWSTRNDLYRLIRSSELFDSYSPYSFSLLLSSHRLSILVPPLLFPILPFLWIHLLLSPIRIILLIFFVSTFSTTQ